MKISLAIGALMASLIAVSEARAGVMQPHDGPYYRWRLSDTIYIYDERAREFIEQVAAYNGRIRQLYDESYSWHLSGVEHLVLASPNQQVPNAYATVVPNLTTVWFPSGVYILDSMASSSWLMVALAHETAHLYQLDAKSDVGSNLEVVFGYTPAIFPLIWPVFLFPNVLTPTSLTEGNAVLAESRFYLGGRLHSGEKRALILAQVKSGTLDAARLINDEFRFPFGEAPYVFGGYFNAHLAAKYGIDRTNRFFAAQGTHWLWPLILNKTFRDHFGNGFYDEANEFVRGLAGMAESQRVSPEPTLANDVFVGPMNHDDDRIWWLGTDGTEAPRLYTFDKTLGKLTSEQVDLQMGKVFFENSEPWSATTFQYDSSHLEYSLYGVGGRLNPLFLGQIVTDRRSGTTVSLDARGSWLEGHLLRNGEPYDIGHSHAVLDDQGRIYYFRQNGNERLLYRDRLPLARYDGYYGKLTEVDRQGRVYFIGNTEFGSSLFRWDGHEFTRVLESDRVVDARSISDGNFLAVEVEASGHRIARATISSQAREPSVYLYGFPSQPFSPLAPTEINQRQAEERPYSAMAGTRLNSVQVQSAFWGRARLGMSASAEFSDPLERQALAAGFAYSLGHDRGAMIRYSYTRYRPSVYTQYSYLENWYRQPNQEENRTHNHSLRLGTRYQILRWRRWDAELDFAAVYRDEEAAWLAGAKPSVGTRRASVGWAPSFEIIHRVPAPLGFYPWREWRMAVGNRTDFAIPGGGKRHDTSSVELAHTRGLGGEFYARLFGQSAWADRPDIWVGFTRPFSDDLRVSRLAPGRHDLAAASARVARMELTRVLSAQVYSSIFPIGLHRIAPLLVAQGLDLTGVTEGHERRRIFEYGYGADFDLLILHKITGRLRLLVGVDPSAPDRAPQTGAQLQIGGHF